MRFAARLCTATMVTFEVRRFGHPGWRCASFYAARTSHPLCYVSFPIRVGGARCQKHIITPLSSNGRATPGPGHPAIRTTNDGTRSLAKVRSRSYPVLPIRHFEEIQRAGIPRNCWLLRCPRATSSGTSIYPLSRGLLSLHTLTTRRVSWRRRRMDRGTSPA